MKTDELAYYCEGHETEERKSKRIVHGFKLCLIGQLALLESQNFTICMNEEHENDKELCCLHATAFGHVEEMHNQLDAMVEEAIDFMLQVENAPSVFNDLNIIWKQQSRKPFLGWDCALTAMIECCENWQAEND